MTGQQLPEIVTAPPGARSRALSARLDAVESPAFEARRQIREGASGAEQGPIVYARGEGSNVWDVDGNRYVDLTMGFGALALGHRPAAVKRAMDAQSQELWLALGDVYASEVKVALAERLVALYPEPRARVMFGLSGADAVTAAIKTAALCTGKPGVVAFTGGYHGLSYAPLAACGLSGAFREPFAAQLGDHVRFVPYPSRHDDLGEAMSAVRSAMSGDVGCVLVEPILGRGGCVVPPDGFLGELRRACDESGALLVADEVWTGMGRSGAMLASAVERPDVICLGKALGAGLPISACIGSERAMQAWAARGGTAIHTATHFGGPMGCAAAMAALSEIESRGLIRRASSTGGAWRKALEEATRDHGVREVRGRGMMIGIELEGGAGRALAVSRGLLGSGFVVLTGGVEGNVLTLTPALDVSEELMRAFTRTVAEVAATVRA
jgi:4-aminobutyrate aminotransferase / (S)-3-amino-2-methylpropionate transaminase / 5-aminovalerate transaminase